MPYLPLWAAACIGLVPPLSDRLSTLGRGCGNGLKMRGFWEVAAAGSAGKRGGKNFLMRGDLGVGGVAEIG